MSVGECVWAPRHPGCAWRGVLPSFEWDVESKWSVPSPRRALSEFAPPGRARGPGPILRFYWTLAALGRRQVWVLRGARAGRSRARCRREGRANEGRERSGRASEDRARPSRPIAAVEPRVGQRAAEEEKRGRQRGRATSAWPEEGKIWMRRRGAAAPQMARWMAAILEPAERSRNLSPIWTVRPPRMEGST